MSVDPYGFPEAPATPSVADNTGISRWLTILLVPILVLNFSFAYYLARSNQWMLADSQGIDPSSLGTLGTAGAVVGLIAGVGLSAALGGAAAVLAGVGTWLLGIALMIFGMIEVGTVLTGIGRYMFNVGASAALARALRFEGARVAMFSVLYAMINLGALLIGPMSWIGQAFGVRVQLGLAGVFGVVALLVAVPLLLVQLLRPPETAAQLERGWHPQLLAGAGITAAIVVPLYIAWSWGMDLQWQAAMFSGAGGDWWMSLNPLVVVLTAGLLAVLTGGLSIAGFQVPSLAVAGAGALLLALGLAPTVLGDVAFAAAPLLFGQLFSGLGEPLFFAGVQARMLGGVHWRVAPAFAAVLSGCGLIASLVGRLFHPEGLAGVLATSAGGLVFLGGLGLFLAAFFLRERPAHPAPPIDAAVAPPPA